VENISRPAAGRGYLPDRYLNTPNAANKLTPGEPECGGAVLATKPKPHTYVNGKDVGYPQNSKHMWGSCLVQDFNGGPFGWVIVSYTGGTHIVSNGMLWGWFDNGGASGSLGCPLNDEHGSMNGVRQDFQHGSLYWLSGMNHAQRIDSGREGALQWAWEHIGQVFWADLCLQFAVYSYHHGQGWHLKGPYGKKVRAVDWWYSRPVSARHNRDRNPPRGALVFWDSLHGGDGHAALSLGGGWVISTKFGGNSAVHVFRIADWSSHYLGWIAPA
jgi:hypothetical protein